MKRVEVILCALLALGCLPRGTPEAFEEAERTPLLLERGTTTKKDVLALLGEPFGYGHFQLEPQKEGAEIWFYLDIETLDSRYVDGELWSAWRQRILLVFFHEEYLSGYLAFGHESELPPKP